VHQEYEVPYLFKGREMANNRVRIFLLIFAARFIISACNLERSTATLETQVNPNIGTPLTTEGSPAPIIETTVIPTIPKVSLPSILERPGLKITYTKDGNLHLWTVEGKKQLTSSGDAYSPRISPDGLVVAFLRPVNDFHLELWAINTDGANERPLVSVADLDTIGGGVRDPNAVAINPFHYKWVLSSSTPDKKSLHQLAFNTQQVFQG
jgi:hypothetical protein